MSTIDLAPGTTMPDYLEYELTFEWTRNEVYLGEYSKDAYPTTDWGEYVLTPVLRIYDRSLYDPYNPDPYHNEVTALYGYALESYAPMEYFVTYLILYVEVNANKDTYSLSESGGIVTLNASNGITVTINNLEVDDPMWEFIDTLPSGIVIRITGTASFSETGDSIVIPGSFVTVDEYGNLLFPAGEITIYYTDSQGNYLNPDNFIIIPEYGVITITP